MSHNTNQEKLESLNKQLILVNKKLAYVSQAEHNIFNPMKAKDSDEYYQVFKNTFQNELYEVIEQKRRLLLTETRAITADIKTVKLSVKLDALKLKSMNTSDRGK